MRKSAHIDGETLAELVVGTLHGEALRHAEAHLATGCPRCRNDHAVYARVLHLARADHSVDPPPEILARAIRIMPAWQPAAPALGGFWRRLRAVPLFDSRHMLDPIGARGGESDVRQVLYGVDELQLEIDVQASRPAQEPGTVEILGQLFPWDEDPASVADLSVALIGGVQTVKTTTSPLGTFRIRGVPEADAELLVVSVKDCTVAIPLLLP